jgi:hypothetical protein
MPPDPDRDMVDAQHRRVLAELVAPGDWWDGAARRAILEEVRAAWSCAPCVEHGSSFGTPPPHTEIGSLPAAAVAVIHRLVHSSARLSRPWVDAQIAALGDAEYAELVAVTATIVAIDVYSRAVGDPPYDLPAPVDGPPARVRPEGMGDVGAWIPMAEEKLMANVSRALTLVPRTNTTWRSFVTDAYSRGPEMLELTWDRALSRPQIELIASRVSQLQECFY